MSASHRVLSIALAITLLLGHAHAALTWHADWDAALKAAKTSKKLVMADVYTDWCKWCKVMDKETFGDARVAGSLAELELVRVNAEKGGGVDIRKRFSVNGFPTILFVDEKGEEVDRISGYVKPEPFMVRLEQIRRGEGTFGDLRARAKQDPSDLEVSKALADKYMERGDGDEAGRRYDEILAKDPNDELGFAAQIHLAKARASLARRDQAAAQSGLEKVVALDDADATRQAYPALRRLYLMQERSADIDRLHDSVTGRLQDDAQVLNDIAWFYASRSERLDQALAWAERSARLAPEDGSVLDTLAEVHHRRGEHEQAIATIERAVRIDPSSDYFQKQLTRFKAAAR